MSIQASCLPKRIGTGTYEDENIKETPGGHREDEFDTLTISNSILERIGTQSSSKKKRFRSPSSKCDKCNII
ncbi:hypothetical protein SteCoe_2463 [Stentor coeruleus]|uniref:Uncharacterized protein n=1 Tax=Stentor coeruleus TaxID=5963 RepID=A0A1R2CZL0_9CILI|nr:hypothetical protein SteCoe_2463 [Stentor coeruleus]